MAAAIAATALLGAQAQTASAASFAPTLTSASAPNRYIAAQWTLPNGADSHVMEVSPTTATNADGSFSSPQTIRKEWLNIGATWDNLTERSEPGTYYVHVGAREHTCFPSLSWCGIYYSQTLPVAVEYPDPPVITSVHQTLRRISANWWPGAYLYSSVFEVSNSQDVDADGYFSSPDTWYADLWGGDSSIHLENQLPAGTWYVHVGGVESMCATDCQVFFSSPVQIVLPQDPPSYQPGVKPQPSKPGYKYPVAKPPAKPKKPKQKVCRKKAGKKSSATKKRGCAKRKAHKRRR